MQFVSKTALVFSIVALFLCTPSTVSSEPEGVARNALNAWIAAVISADPDRVRRLLAPEFQIVRGSGRRYDAPAYVAEGLPKLGGGNWEVADMKVTKAGDIMVVSYWLVIDVSEGDHKLSKRAPRLTVFREIDGAWQVSAHANFAVPVN